MMSLGEIEKVVIVGGAGHVGLPFGLVLADNGYEVTALDRDEAAVRALNDGRMPFMEVGAHELLVRMIESGRLVASTDNSSVSDADVVVVVVGTPVDEHLNPDPNAVLDLFKDLSEFFHPGQLVILRSTVFPGVTRKVEDWFASKHPGVSVSFCPERIAEGSALEEIMTLPQLVGARSADISQRAEAFFGAVGIKTIRVDPEEAELAKLFTNSWRYIRFATANQFWMMANDFGVDFERVRTAMSAEYPRAADVPSAGFSAGPCLFKDTMQLSAMVGYRFSLGDAAVAVNEGAPLYLVERLEQRFDLPSLTIGILGMAFKADIDDNRSSLSYKLRKLLVFKAARVLCADPYVVDERLVSQEHLLEESDVVIVATPHSVYRTLSFSQPVVDVWNLYGDGVLI